MADPGKTLDPVRHSAQREPNPRTAEATRNRARRLGPSPASEADAAQSGRVWTMLQISLALAANLSRTEAPHRMRAQP